MNLKKFLELGYFPKELPPPFSTLEFAKKSAYVKRKWNEFLDEERSLKINESGKEAKKRFNSTVVTKYGSSQILNYSISKGIYSRRKLSIIHPKQYFDLSIALIDNWKILRNTYTLTDYSQSTPVEKGAKRAVRTKSVSWGRFKLEIIENSFNKKVELKLDISQFYPTIYTHSIPWAILGKEEAKKLFKIKNSQPHKWKQLLDTDENAKKYRIADHIDTLVRNCNDRQSIGLPIGPDSSFVLAEVIANRIDFNIKEKLNNIPHTCIRYYDDYYFYLDNYSDAQSTLKIVQQVLFDFQLETNESKVQIKELPFKYSEPWTSSFSAFSFVHRDKSEFRDYFSILYDSIEKNKAKSEWIVNYALHKFEKGKVKVGKRSWDLFLALLLQTLLTVPSSIRLIFKIILSYKIYLNQKSKGKIKEVLEIIIDDHLPLNHSYEVSWALWSLKSFNIKCSADLLKKILASNDSISKLIALDIIKSRLYDGRKPGLSVIGNALNSTHLFTEDWLFVYESYIKEWLDYKGRQIIGGHRFMEILFDFDISFYNPTNQVRTDFEMTHGLLDQLTGRNLFSPSSPSPYLTNDDWDDDDENDDDESQDGY